MLVAGAGVLAALRVPVRGPLAWLGAVGLAYVTGIASTLLALTILLVAGAPFGLVTFAAVAVAIAAGGFGLAILRRRGKPPEPQPTGSHRLRSAPRRPALDTVVVVVFVVAVAAISWYALDAMRSEPLTEWDGWSIWTRKAIMLVHTDTLSGDFWTGPAYEFMHQDYPLLVPLLEAVFFRAGAAIDTQAVHAQLWLLVIGFVWAAAWVASRVARPLVWAPLLLLVPLTPGLYEQVLSGYADVPVAMFLGLGVLLLGVWIDQRDPWQLWLGALMLAGAAGVKNEGLLGGVAALVCLTVLLLATRERSGLLRLAAAWAVFLVGVLPWRLWMAANDVTGDLPLDKGLSPSYLADRDDRVWPAVETLQGQLADQGQWLYLLPLGAALAIAGLVVGTRRRAAAFYLATGLTTFGGLVWAYWVSPNDLSWHLSTSADRVVASVVLVATAASLHLGGALAPQPRERTSREVQESGP
jgi:hypothetical protein